MIICYYCPAEVNEEYNFCVNCEKQLKCLKCGSWLIKDKSKCLMCGETLVKEQLGETTLNTYTLEETYTRNSFTRKINVAATTEAIGKIAPTLGGLSPHIRSKANRYPIPTNQNQLLIPIDVNEEEVAQEQSMNVGNENEESEKTNDTYSKPEKEVSLESLYFNVDSKGYLNSLTTDYKGFSKKEQQERFCILYIGEHLKIKKEPVPDKDHIIQAGKLNGLYDKNFTTYLGKLNKYINNTDKKYLLNPSGNKYYIKITKEIEDDNITGFDLTSAKKARVPGSRIDREAVEMVDKLIKLPSKLSEIDIRSVDSTVKICILAVYDITRKLKVEEGVSAAVAYEYLSKRCKNTTLSKASFIKCISRKDSSKYFSKTTDGRYHTTMAADKLAEAILL